MLKEWSGRQCDVAPDTCWIDDTTGEHVNAYTNQRTPEHLTHYNERTHKLKPTGAAQTDRLLRARLRVHSVQETYENK